jgi:hypothetical protein
MNDDELREQFIRWASPLRIAPPPAVSMIRSRAGRRRSRILAAIGSALLSFVIAALIIIGIVALVSSR